MITLADAQGAAGGEWLQCPLPAETPLRGGAFDTRALDGAEIFFAIRGESGDGHDHLGHLAGTPVRLAVVERGPVPSGFEGAVLCVADSRAALARMAAHLVEKFRPFVVAVTGSYGKTTAKEVIAHVLAAERKVLKTPGSFNNEIGVPIALLGLDGSQEAAVLEFGARRPGDIDLLGKIAPPDVAVLLNVGRAHVGVFGSLEGTYRAKGEIFRHLRPEGLAVVNGEDPRLRELAEGRRILTFGREGDFRAEAIAADGKGCRRFRGIHGEARLDFRAEFSGAHSLYPMLAAWAVAREAGIADAAVAQRAGADPAQRGRSRLLKGPGGATVIDDTYNASPETVANLIATLADLDEPDTVLVLGHLSELESGLEESARAIAAHLRPPLGELWLHDPEGSGTADRLARLAEGLTVRRLESLPELIAALRERDRAGVAIGIKGSRSAHMERAVAGLLGRKVGCLLDRCPLLMQCTECPELEGT